MSENVPFALPDRALAANIPPAAKMELSDHHDFRRKLYSQLEAKFLLTLKGQSPYPPSLGTRGQSTHSSVSGKDKPTYSVKLDATYLGSD